MSRFVALLAVVLGMVVATTARAAVVQIPLIQTTLGTSGVAAGNSSYAVINGGGNVELYNETGSGFAWARYDLSTPITVYDVWRLSYTVRVLGGDFPFGPYIANPVLVIDADNDNVQEADPTGWIDSLNPADLGHTGGNDGDAIYGSDVWYASLSSPEATFSTQVLIGPGSLIDTGGGWYHSNQPRNAFNFSDYLPFFPARDHLPHDDIDQSDNIYAIYIVDGGSPAFQNHKIEISDVQLFTPEPASIVLLAVGGVLISRRRAHAR